MAPMNQNRRRRIIAIHAQITDLIDQIGTLRDEEEAGFDHLPEAFQEAEQGESMRTAIDSLESAADVLGESLGFLDEAGEQ